MDRRHVLRMLMLIAALILAVGCGQTPTALPVEPTESADAEPTAAPTATTAPSSTPTATAPAPNPETTPTAAPDTPAPVEEQDGTPVEGWTGTVRDLPPGNQFGQVFVRDDGEEYGIGATGDAAWAVIREAKETGARIQVWGTLYTGVPASEARHVEVERLSVLSDTPDEGTPVEGWTGTVVKLPPGNQFGQFFIRENGEPYTLSGTEESVRTQIAGAAWTGAQIEVWGILHTGVPAADAGHLEVERAEVGAPSDAPRYLSPFAEATASSHLSADRHGTYGPYAAIDGQLETAWAEGVEGSGVGEWIRLDFPAAVAVHAIHVDVGFDKDADLFAKNNRVREATLRFSDGQEVTVTFDDVRGMQPISVTDLFGGPVETTSVELVIEDVTPGSAYDDTCIAEIEVYGVTE